MKHGSDVLHVPMRSRNTAQAVYDIFHAGLATVSSKMGSGVKMRILSFNTRHNLVFRKLCQWCADTMQRRMASYLEQRDGLA
jgi:hypothetical protein